MTRCTNTFDGAAAGSLNEELNVKNQLKTLLINTEVPAVMSLFQLTHSAINTSNKVTFS